MLLLTKINLECIRIQHVLFLCDKNNLYRIQIRYLNKIQML